MTVTPATPTISTTQQPASVTVGGTIADQVTVSGGYNPTGTVTFNLYANPNGTGTPAFTDTETLSGGTATSASFTTTGTGTGYWVATYNGDANNNSVTSITSAEPVTVTPATPTISTTQQPASVTVGGTIADQVTVSGGYNPTGTVTFNLYANPNGTGTPAFTDTETLSGGTATSASFTTTGTGTGYWVATYNGDGNNNSVTSVTSAEPVTVTAASPTVTTSASETLGGVVGSSVLSDSATLAGSYNGTGTITFSLTAPDGSVTTFPAVTVSGNNTYTSPNVTATQVGTYTWHAAYSGDSNNNSAMDNGTNESLTTVMATPGIATIATPTVIEEGGSIADEAFVYGGDNPTGTVTFNLYNNSSGTGPALYTVTETLSGGTATSGNYSTTATGTVYWVVTYNGDSNNTGVTSGDASEPVMVVGGP